MSPGNSSDVEYDIYERRGIKASIVSHSDISLHTYHREAVVFGYCCHSLSGLRTDSAHNGHRVWWRRCIKSIVEYFKDFLLATLYMYTNISTMQQAT